MIPGAACSLAGEGQERSTERQPSRFMARQPILNARREVIGYELLFRTGWENSFRGEADDATRKMMDHCLCEGVESLVDGGLAFVNCTREALLERLVTLLPARTTVLELLETIEPDPEVLAACHELRRIGYRLALDDFLPRPEMQPLVEIASYVKVDLRLSDAAMRRKIRDMTRNSQAALLAEKVENQEEFDRTLAEGYEYFQGYFFCRPKILANCEIPPNRMNYLRLLIELTRTPLNVREVLQIVGQEPSLCYRLLRMANSALWGVREAVTSVRGAFMLVGEERFRLLVSIAASSVLSQHQSPALIRLSLERARFCELLAPSMNQNPTEQFMLGLLSLLDAMLDTPMESIMKSLPLRDEAKAALLGGANDVSLALRMVQGFESGATDDLPSAVDSPMVSEESLTDLYLESVRWAAASVNAGN